MALPAWMNRRPADRCEETTSRGYGCINPAQDGKRVCVSHDPARQCGAKTVSGDPCKRLKVHGHLRCSKHLPLDAA